MSDSHSSSQSSIYRNSNDYGLAGLAKEISIHRAGVCASPNSLGSRKCYDVEAESITREQAYHSLKDVTEFNVDDGRKSIMLDRQSTVSRNLVTFSIGDSENPYNWSNVRLALPMSPASKSSDIDCSVKSTMSSSPACSLL